MEGDPPVKSRPITYETMTAALVEELPELKPIYDRELERWEEEMGQHVMYRYVMYSAIEAELKDAHPNENLLRKIFDFLELLADHSDMRVRAVAQESVCGKICSDEVVLQKALRFMGKRTRELCGLIIDPQK
jgi:hypothetical protein